MIRKKQQIEWYIEVMIVKFKNELVYKLNEGEKCEIDPTSILYIVECSYRYLAHQS